MTPTPCGRRGASGQRPSARESWRFPSGRPSLRRRLQSTARRSVAAIAAELVVRSRELTVRANEIEAEIRVIVRRLAPALLALPGCGVLSAAKIVGEVAGGSRFRSPAAFARWNGTAPIPVSSGKTDRQRLNRAGNRQVNAALHRIGVTQWRGVGTIGRAYVERRIAAGDSKTEALRMLRRRLSEEVFRRLLIDEAFFASVTESANQAA